jgi:hypothetical protein
MSDELRTRLRANAQRRRAEHGLPKRREIATVLADAVGYRVPTTDFLSVQASDSLMEAVAARVEGMAPHATWLALSPLVFGGLAAWANATEGFSAYLSLEDSEFAGMPLVPVAPLLRNLNRLWNPPTSDLDLVLATSEAEDGFWLSWDDQIIDLWAWGRLKPVAS